MDAVDKCWPFLVGIRGVRQIAGNRSFDVRMPTFRHRFTNLGKLLYIDAVQGDASAHTIGGILTLDMVVTGDHLEREIKRKDMKMTMQQ
ncbi:hypothetical protein V6N11_059977 [Hibiscus sabdariffa]